jgi:sec-independent protein translocase protein TatC
MSLGDHLRELRKRFLIALGAIVVASVLGWARYEWLLARLQEPLKELRATRTDGSIITINFSGLTDAFATQITVSLFVGLVVSSPIWLWQLWAFVVPGLTRKEKRITMAFTFAAAPLFLTGCYLAYLTVPKAVAVLLGFTPAGAANITDAAVYLNFLLKFIIAFGLAFLLPVFLVAFDLIGVLRARTMLKAWRPAVMILFAFAAIMTPTPDPYSMLMLGTPMVGLYFLAVGISAIIDRRRAKHEPEWLGVPDEEASAL